MKNVIPKSITNELLKSEIQVNSLISITLMFMCMEPCVLHVLLTVAQDQKYFYKPPMLFQLNILMQKVYAKSLMQKVLSILIFVHP